MPSNWKLAPEYPEINLVGNYHQHLLIAHAMEAYEIFAPHIHTLYITSANDREHSQNSLHYEDRALDFRTWGTQSRTRWAIATYLSYKYPDEDWVNEGDHIHGEFDPK